MTVAEMIEILKELPQNAKVTAYDAESEQDEPVTGFLYDDNFVQIETDDIS